MSLTDEEMDIVKEIFSYPKHDCPSCTCQCAIIPRNSEFSPKVTINAEKGNMWYTRLNEDGMLIWLPKKIVMKYFIE